MTSAFARNVSQYSYETKLVLGFTRMILDASIHIVLYHFLSRSKIWPLKIILSLINCIIYMYTGR